MTQLSLQGNQQFPLQATKNNGKREQAQQHKLEDQVNSEVWWPSSFIDPNQKNVPFAPETGSMVMTDIVFCLSKYLESKTKQNNSLIYPMLKSMLAGNFLFSFLHRIPKDYHDYFGLALPRDWSLLSQITQSSAHWRPCGGVCALRAMHKRTWCCVYYRPMSHFSHKVGRPG